MKATADRVENNKVNLEIEVEAEKVDAALERAYRKVAGRVNIPGFRKGRVPRVIIESRIGKEVLYDEALEELIPEAYQYAVTSTEIEPIDRPTVTEVDIEEGRPLKISAVVEVTPEVTLGEYKGLQVERLVEQVDTADIDHMLEHFQDEHAELEATDRTTVEEGDFAQIDFEGFIDGLPFEGGAAKGYPLEIGSGQFIPGFEDQLIAAEVGQEIEVNVTFPEDYGNELAGKDALFKVTVQQIKVKRVPELDDDFATTAGEAKTMLEWRAKIRENMEQQAESRADRDMRDRLVEQLAESAQVDIPQIMIRRQSEELLQEFTSQLAQTGTTFEQWSEQTGRSREDVLAEMEEPAQEQVKRRLALDALAKREGITVDEDELEANITELIEESQYPDMMRQIVSDPQQRDAFRANMMQRKTIDFLVTHAEIEQKSIPSKGHGHHHG